MAVSKITDHVNYLTVGDSITLGNTYPTYAGLVLSATRIEFDVPLAKPIDAANVTAITFDHLYLRVWNTNGTQVIDNVDVANTTGYVITPEFNEYTGFKVRVENAGLNFGTQGQLVLVNLRAGSVVNFTTTP